MFSVYRNPANPILVKTNIPTFEEAHAYCEAMHPGPGYPDGFLYVVNEDYDD